MPWNISLPPTIYVSHNTPSDQLQAIINEVSSQKAIGIDTETTGLLKWKEVPLYWSMAWGDRRATLHASVLPYFQQAFSNPSITWALANAKFDMHMLANVGIIIKGIWHDIQVMHALLYDDRLHNLKFIAKHILDWTWASFEDTFGEITPTNTAADRIRRAEMEDFDLLVEYAANDAYGTLKGWEELMVQLGREYTLSLFNNVPPYINTLQDFFLRVEAPYTKALWDMERRGIMVNQEKLQAARPDAEAKIRDLERQLVKTAGFMINPKSVPQLRHYFFEIAKLAPLSMTDGGKSGNRQPQVNDTFLEHYKNENEFAGLLLEYRQYTKLLDTYIIGLNEWVDPNGRIHSTFKQDVVRCMPAGELVLTNRGHVPIEQVVIGDSVLTHIGRWRTVLETYQYGPTDIYIVETITGDQLRTSSNHKYLIVNDDGFGDNWIEACHVDTTMNCLVYNEGIGFTPCPILSVSILPNQEPVYGIAVDEDHSHVTGGIVTHNSGRLSSTDPALQTIPRPENDHWALREAFIAPPGKLIISADYNQLEMRLLAAAAMEQAMIDIFAKGWDIHSGNASFMYGVPYEDITLGKKYSKKADGMDPTELANICESTSSGILTRCNGNLSSYLTDCASKRSAIKNIGFGQPISQAEVKPAQNGEAYGLAA